MKRYIHYGSDKFDPDRFVTFNKDSWTDYYSSLNKPGKAVGLWGSPAAGCYISWREWCEEEGFNLDKLKKSFVFTLRPKARILKIRSVDDIEPYLTETADIFPGSSSIARFLGLSINFRKISSKFDGMELIHSSKTYCELHNSYFYSWDCDSIIVWRKEAIRV